MTDYIRRLVSGQKARFKDGELKVELDLVYVTDQVIIMGYPASGFEGYYRNRREDVKKFLDHRHGGNYWIFNFCPLKENSYDSQYFEGRVSRYPFPDHHAPPLAIMPLVAREMRAWLSGSPDRVAVLHCKAGKGRSGTTACAYLLSLDEEPAPPKLQRSHTRKEWAKRRAEETMDVLPEDRELDKMHAITTPLLQPSSSVTTGSDTTDVLDPEETGKPPLTASPGSVSPTSANPERSFTDALKGVLDLHTARRMKTPSDPQKKQKQGVSIPSQRRYLHYWALCLAYEAPAGFWSLTPSPSPSLSLSPRASPSPDKKRVRLTEIKLRLREMSTIKLGLVKAANLVMGKTKNSDGASSVPVPSAQSSASIPSGETHASPRNNGSNGVNHVWASLARYDDDFVTTLEKWEKHTRDDKGRLGVRRPGSERMGTDSEGEGELSAIFRDGRWDQHKMIRSFARLGEVGETSRIESYNIDKDEKILTYTLRPLSTERWEDIKEEIKDKSSDQTEQAKTEDFNLPADENRSMYDSLPGPNTSISTSTSSINARLVNQEQGVILDAEREVRIKLYMGQVFMGWIWLIPTFHMPHPAPTETNNSNDDSFAAPTRTSIRLTRKEVDFPIGLGTGIVDVEISLEWVVPSDVRRQAEALSVADPGKRDEIEHVLSEPPVCAAADSTDEPASVAATLAGVLAGTGDDALRTAVETQQGAED